MSSFNKVILMGNITRDIELRSTAGDKSVAQIGLAVNRRYTTGTGEKREEVAFIDCEAWGITAEVMAKNLAKGRPVLIEGRLKLDQWDDKATGEKRSKLKVVVESFEFVGSRADAEASPPPSLRPKQAKAPAKPPRGYEPIDEDSIPF